ncbi:ATP-grasp domain-containing protein [Rheinheimera faecalis]|uniref:ATP-grasp domain-containing protein n=1 Tax=Rheinheimera faecalis TaxID=2901141 RepID=UPI001E490742|nr:ATP-grasp domain-containing protein [Rheinheimera faecalis]
MNILILHRIPYHYIRYAESVDHHKHRVYYVGVQSALDTIPVELNCIKIARLGVQAVAQEVLSTVAGLGIQFDFVISLSEYELMEAAKVREALGVKGPSVAQVEKVRNKVVMKACVAQHQLAVPAFMSLQQWADHSEPCFRKQINIILKPVDGASSENVIRYGSEQELRSALSNRKTGIAQLDQPEPNYNGYQVEEFIDGPICHFDGLMHAGELQIITAGRYINTLLQYANGQPCASVQFDLTEQQIQWVKQVLNAVDIQQGAFHLEAIMHQGELVFLEVANRAGGARLIQTFELQTGIHLPSAELAFLISGQNQLKARMDREFKYSWIIFPGHHYGFEYCQVHGSEHLNNYSGLIEMNLLPPTQKLPTHISYLESAIPFAALIKAPSTELLEQKVLQLFNTITITAQH